MSIEYVVHLEPFAESHFVKSFARKYKGVWGSTWDGLLLEFKNFEVIKMKSYATFITEFENIKIYKVEFRIHATQESRRSSGNRYIVALDDEQAEARILLVYCKTDVKGARETDWWQKMIRNNYPEYKGIF
jgi:hypothetical protein